MELELFFGIPSILLVDSNILHFDQKTQKPNVHEDKMWFRYFLLFQYMSHFLIIAQFWWIPELYSSTILQMLFLEFI